MKKMTWELSVEEGGYKTPLFILWGGKFETPLAMQRDKLFEMTFPLDDEDEKKARALFARLAKEYDPDARKLPKLGVPIKLNVALKRGMPL